MIAYITHKGNEPNVEIYDDNKHVSVQCLDEEKAYELLIALRHASGLVEIAN